MGAAQQFTSESWKVTAGALSQPQVGLTQPHNKHQTKFHIPNPYPPPLLALPALPQGLQTFILHQFLEWNAS